MRNYFLTILLLLITISVKSQTIISGNVTNTAGKPVPDIIVKLMVGTKTFAFCSTDKKGHYEISFKNKDANLSIQFSHISYNKETIRIENKSSVHDMILTAKDFVLHEIKVKADRLRVTGDTLKYNLASFLGKGDVTLEDGIKRLPGIDVSKEGKINYMGNPITQFYIEGLDMLGGRYNLATKNIPSDYATQVEILRHHKSRKIDKDLPSNDVAINVKLSKKAKFKPIGEIQTGIGWQGKSMLYGLGATGMMFMDRFQLLASLKYGNYNDFASSDMIDHFRESNAKTSAMSLLEGFSTGRPPQGDYLYCRNGMTTLNAIKKISTNSTVKINADYSYSRSYYNSYTSSTYLTDGNYITVDERMSPLTITHKPCIKINVNKDTDNIYIGNTLKMNGLFERNDGDIISNGNQISQSRKASGLDISNSFSISTELGHKRIGFDSFVQFTHTPSLRMSFTNTNGRTINQTAQSTDFNTTESSYFSLKLNKTLTVEIPIQINAKYSFLETALDKDSSMVSNRLRGWKIEPKMSPNLRLETNDKRMNAQITADLRYMNMNYTSIMSSDKLTLHGFYLDPSVILNYIINGNNELNFSSSYTHNIGDMVDLLTNPVQKNYRSTYASSGIIGKTSNWNSSLRYQLQLPMQFFNLFAYASYNQNRRNVLNSQFISGTDISNSTLNKDSHSKYASFKFSASKSIPSIYTKIQVGGNFSWNSNEMTVQSDLVTSHNNTYSCNSCITINPIQWMEINYDINYTKSFTRYSGTRNSIESLSHDGSISLFPIERLAITTKYNYIHQQITTSQYKNMALFDASVQYKMKPVTIKLELNNLLNTRHYAYTVFDTVNTYSYDYNLCGRTIMLSLLINK